LTVETQRQPIYRSAGPVLLTLPRKVVIEGSGLTRRAVEGISSDV